jgi:NAD(P)H-hydrate repair Nnr-like enzyme with NAD(P)H-hydrate dehydratase domain
LNASIFGVYQHGMDGDLAVEGMGYQALIASDIIDKIGSAFIELFKQDEPTPDQGQEATN